MDQSIVDAITAAANESGIDPAFALAVADRESSFDPNAHASKTIYGLFQMSGDLRRQYGVGNSSDPYTQAKGWTAFIGDQKAQMASALGRAPTNEELYFAHHFGTPRAIQMIGGMSPDTSVRDVFSPYERSINPHFDRAGTTGNLMSSISADMDQRMNKFGGAGNAMDFAAYGQPAGGLTYKSTTAAPGAQPIDFASFGSPAASSNSGPATVPNEGSALASGLADLGQTVGSEGENQNASEEAAPTTSTQGASAEPLYGMSPPMLQAMQSNPGYMAERMAQARGGRAGQEVDASQFGIKAPDRLKNPGLSGGTNLQNPALGLG
jgi:hypothetical protein